MRNAEHGPAAFQAFPLGALDFISPTSSPQTGQGAPPAEPRHNAKGLLGNMAHM